MSQMPHIKAEVNVDKERDKKKGGLLGLLSRLSGGGGGASGAAGGMGGLGGAAAGGGLLATKAGLIGLVLAGTTVAGGIGMVGWTAFGPGQGDRADNPALQLFASKPKESANPFGVVAPVAADGASASLNYLAKANAGSPGSADAEAPVTEQSAASAAEGDATAASAQSATPHMGESVGTSAPAPKVGLKDVRKMGELSKSFGGAGSGGASASAAPLNTGAGATASNAASKGSLGGFAQRSSANQSIGRGLARARGGSATRQAMNALGDNRKAFSSQAAGRTYDGSSAAGAGTTGVDAGLPSAGGPGVGSGGQQPTSTPNTAAQKNEFEPPPTPKSKNVTPYQKALNMAQMMLGAAAALLMIAYFFSKSKEADVTQTARTMVMILAGLAAALSLAAVAIGSMISGGKYGQPLQGGLIMAAGGLMSACAAMMIFGQEKNATTGKGDDKAFVLFSGDMPMFMMIAGGGAALALAGSMLSKPKSYPSSEFEGKKVPDIGYQVRPEERSRYTA